jgi:hypothetical protein
LFLRSGSAPLFVRPERSGRVSPAARTHPARRPPRPALAKRPG